MFYIAMAVIGELTFMVFRILEKRLRNAGAQTLAILAAYGLTIPFWILVIAGFVLLGQVAFTPMYGLIVVAWVATCTFLNFGAVYITKYQSMSEGIGYRFGFSLLVALLVDVFIFSMEFNAEKLLAIALLFSGGVALHFSREKNVSSAMTMALPKRLSIIGFISIVEIATYTLFKQGALMQESATYHNAISQFLILCIFIGMGAKPYMQDRAAGKLPTIYLIGLSVLLIIGCLAEGLALAALPLTLIMGIALLRVVIYAVHDIYTKELRLTMANGSAITLILGGLAYMVYLNHNV